MLQTYELICKEKDSLQAQLALAEVEKVFERRTEEIKDHRVIVAFSAEPAYEWYADTAGKRLVDLALILELGVFSLGRLKFNGNFLARDDVNAKVDVTCKMCYTAAVFEMEC